MERPLYYPRSAKNEAAVAKGYLVPVIENFGTQKLMAVQVCAAF